MLFYHDTASDWEENGGIVQESHLGNKKHFGFRRGREEGERGLLKRPLWMGTPCPISS